MLHIDCYETDERGKRMDKVEITPGEALEIYQYGQKQGFIAGVVVCVAVRYLLNRRTRYQNALLEARRNQLR